MKTMKMMILKKMILKKMILKFEKDDIRKENSSIVLVYTHIPKNLCQHSCGFANSRVMGRSCMGWS